MPYAYVSGTAWWRGDVSYGNSWDSIIPRGEQPIDLLFQCFANKRSPLLSLHLVPAADRNAAAQTAIRDMIAMYKQGRRLMQRRTVLKAGAGVRWDNDAGRALVFSFREQTWPGPATDVVTGAAAPGGRLQPNHVYELAAAGA